MYNLNWQPNNYKLQILNCLILTLNELREEQSVSSTGRLFHSLAALNLKERSPHDRFTLGKIKFLVQLCVLIEWILLNLRNFSKM